MGVPPTTGSPGVSAAAPGAAFGQGWPVSQGRREQPLGLPPPSLESPPGVGKDTQAPWPKTLPDQFQALRSALTGHPGPATAADLAQGFVRAPRAKVAELLASLGHARHLDDGRYLPG